MAKFCSLEDFKKDELLSDMVTEQDIADTHEFVEDFSWSKGVDPLEIPNTHVPYKVKQLAINYTYMMVAQNASIMNQKGTDGADAYELKRKVYAAKVDALKDEITVPVLLGAGARESCFPVIRMVRA